MIRETVNYRLESDSDVIVQLYYELANSLYIFPKLVPTGTIEEQQGLKAIAEIMNALQQSDIPHNYYTRKLPGGKRQIDCLIVSWGYKHQTDMLLSQITTPVKPQYVVH